ncbi:NAD-dependent epimerase/dehydratase family protein [Glaciihabitans sp. INWT7]|uniref:NAD-dependent epimerase/dehydratase family protein n=1 Tax=Glaciihabitans sp. INWT7 TaxID=2596912 RepID=UPI001625A1EC|nr:NAD-dependent epimerase/dehydratase family protein [Glaciihabitans sp. INWT7]QNE45980.1 NAD-dependent epimerase/dehydratase family protein [Glaciihabitans sp. INWT7]
MAKAVVIGANGFIGSHLVDVLAAEGHDVAAFGRFSSSAPKFTAKGVQIVRGEFLNRTDVDSLVEGADSVFHFLSTTTPATAESDPTLDIRTNVVRSVELLEACVAAEVGHVYFASTGGAIYGPQGKQIYVETDRTDPVSPYAIGKLSIENYLRYFEVMHGLRSTALRISNPYGTRQPPLRRQGLIPIALRQILTDQPIVRFGDGSMVRDYLYVEDLVRMIARMVDKTPAQSTYNLGSGVGHSVADVLDSLHRVTGRELVVVEKPIPATFVDRVVLDTSRFRTEFGEFDLTSLDEGVSRTYEEMRAQHEQ